MYSFFAAFFEALKGIVTSYATYIVDDAVAIFAQTDFADQDSRACWLLAMHVLAQTFEHDQDEHWPQPAHFSSICPPLLAQVPRVASSEDLYASLAHALTALAKAADSPAHLKTINTALLAHLRDADARTRLVAVRLERALTAKLGADWLVSLAEMLPRIGELQDDEDEEVETETARWIVDIEGVMGESLDSMLR